MKFFLLLVVPLILKCCTAVFHETEKSYTKSGPINRLYINPKRPYEGFYEKRRMKERGFISEESILFPVLKVFETNDKTNSTYSYFVKINQRERAPNQNLFKKSNLSINKKKKKYPVQLYQVLETCANNPYKFRFMYLFEEIYNEKEEINNEKNNEIKELVYKSYEKEEKKVNKMELLFKSKWLFNWKIYVIRVFLEDNKEESFAIVDEKDSNKNKMEITHCLGSDRMEINLEYLD